MINLDDFERFVAILLDYFFCVEEASSLVINTRI